MSWFGNVQEVLGVPAPELVFFTVIKHALSPRCLKGPLALELLLESGGELHHFDLLRCKYAKEEGSLFFLLVLDLRIGYDYIVHMFLIMDGIKPNGLGDFALFEPLTALSSLKDDVVPVDFPEAVSLGFNPYNHEVDRDVGSLGDLFILLHEGDDQLGLFGN